MRKLRKSNKHPFNPPIFIPQPFAASPDHIFPRPRLYKEDENELGASPGSHPDNAAIGRYPKATGSKKKKENGQSGQGFRWERLY